MFLSSSWLTACWRGCKWRPNPRLFNSIMWEPINAELKTPVGVCALQPIGCHSGFWRPCCVSGEGVASTPPSIGLHGGRAPVVSAVDVPEGGEKLPVQAVGQFAGVNIIRCEYWLSVMLISNSALPVRAVWLLLHSFHFTSRQIMKPPTPPRGVLTFAYRSWPTSPNSQCDNCWRSWNSLTLTSSNQRVRSEVAL